MRVAFLTLLVFGLPALAEDKKDNNPLPKEKWNISVFEKRWGLEMKSLTCKEAEQRMTFAFLFELGTDLDQAKLNDLVAHAKQGGKLVGEGELVAFFFDAEEVRVKGTGFSSELDGILKGKKGERFRLKISFVANELKGISRIELKSSLEESEKK